MKKFLILFILFSNTAFSQSYYPLLRQNVSWDVFDYIAGPICDLSGASRYYIDGDTLINGITYKVIKGHPIVNLNPGPFCHPFGVDPSTSYFANYFMREDTTTKQLYVIDHTNNAPEELLFDFKLQQGDTVNSNYIAAGVPYVIDSIGTYLMPDNSTRRIFYGSPTSYNEFFIEGVGSSTGLFHPLYWAIGAGHRLSCVLENNISIYSAANAFGCVGYVGIDEVSDMRIEFYPNPAHEKLFIKNEKKSNLEFTFQTLHGEIIFQETSNLKLIELDLHSQSPGTYFIKIISDNRTISTSKVVIF